MKRSCVLILMLSLVLIFTSCSGGGGGNDEDSIPQIANARLVEDPSHTYEPMSFALGSVVYLTFEAYDEGKDIKCCVVSTRNADTLEIEDPETEVSLPSQPDKYASYYLQFMPDTTGKYIIYIYVKDKAGNISNILSKTATVN